MVRRPLPGSEEFDRRVREERLRRLRRAVLIACLLVGLATSAYLLAGGELPDVPTWLRSILDGRGKAALARA